MRLRAALLTVALVLIPGTSAADPLTFAHLRSPRKACLPEMTDCVTLPAGFFLSEETYAKLDAKVRELQDAQTRLTAENTSLRTTASQWSPGWISLVTALVVGATVALVVDRSI